MVYALLKGCLETNTHYNLILTPVLDLNQHWMCTHKVAFEGLIKTGDMNQAWGVSG